MKFYTAALLIAAVSSAQAFSVGSSMSSAFGGNVLITGKASTGAATIEMKKGKDNVPPAMRAQYKRQKELQGMREQMMEAQRPGADGLPVFNLYVRTPRGNVSTLIGGSSLNIYSYIYVRYSCVFIIYRCGIHVVP